MFGKNLDIIPLLSDKVDFGFDKIEKHDVMITPWRFLHSWGTVKETVEDSKEGVTTILKQFVAYDKTLTRSETIIVDTQWYLKFKDEVDLDVIKDEIETLEAELEMYSDSKHDDFKEVIETQLKFLVDHFGLEDNE